MSETSFANWESLVKKQLKTEDIYSVLAKENLENIFIKPFYAEEVSVIPTLPKCEESTQLVADYNEDSSENTFAFLINETVDGEEEKNFYINNLKVAEHLSPDESNRYFSLIDVIDEKTAVVNDQLVKELLAKDFARNICIDVSLHQNAGASIEQQLGIALAKTKELTEIYGSDILKKLIFRTAVGNNYFFEIAKIRALKLAVFQLSQEFGLSEIPYIFAETSLRNKAKNDPENNLIRSTLELAAAMIGGADAVYCNNYLLEKPSALSREISFKQQIVLAYESIINVFDDAANGSYFVEDLTKQFTEKAWKLFLEIEEAGGYLELLKQGVVQQKIYEHAVAEQQWVLDGKIKLIGINLYPKLNKTKDISDLYDAKQIKPVRWAEMFE